MPTSPPQTSQQPMVDLDWQLVQDLLPDGWAEQARTSGAFQRARKVKDPPALLRLVLMHAGAGLSFQRTAEAARCTELAAMAKASVWERVQRVGPWLDWLLTGMLSSRVCAPQVAGYRLRAVDATTLTGPAGKSPQRLHYSLSLTSLSCDQVALSDAHLAEGLERFAVCANDLLIGDRIYARARGIAAVKQAGGDVIVRLGRTSLTLYDEAGLPLDVLAWLRQAATGRPAERSARFRDTHGNWIAGRLCAVRLGAKDAAHARKRCLKSAQRRGAKLRATTLEAAGYLCLFTTAPAERLPMRTVLRLYRARWQIELAFKRLKSLLQADQIRETSPASARIWLQGKMLYALLLQACLLRAGAFSPR